MDNTTKYAENKNNNSLRHNLLKMSEAVTPPIPNSSKTSPSENSLDRINDGVTTRVCNGEIFPVPASISRILIASRTTI